MSGYFLNPDHCTVWRNKADKFRINLKKAWWNDQKYYEIPKFREISPCSGPMLPFSTKADVFRQAFFKPCRIFPNAAIPFLFHHAFSEHFITLFPNLAVIFWILPFQASFTMLLLHISPWFVLRCHFSLKPLWKTPLRPSLATLSGLLLHLYLQSSKAIPESNQISSIILLSMKQSGNHPPQEPLE